MPFTQGTTLIGWGVVRRSPWDFRGFYQSREGAEAQAAALGPDYKAVPGEYQDGTDNFIIAEGGNPAPEPQANAGGFGMGAFGVGAFSGPSAVEPEQELSDEELQSIDEMGGPFEADLSGQALDGDREVPSSSWTGISTNRERLIAARKLLPLAHATVGGLIAELEWPRGNGGPPLDDREQAIENLRELHRVIGELLQDLNADKEPSLKQRLLDEAAGYLSRAAQSLQNDPMPYLVSAGLFAMLTAIGAGSLGGYVAGVTSRIKKNNA
jgi:hypothetical protein